MPSRRHLGRQVVEEEPLDQFSPALTPTFPKMFLRWSWTVCSEI